MSENHTRPSADGTQSCPEDEQKIWRPNFPRRSKPCSNIAAVCPLPRNNNAETCENRSQSRVYPSSASNQYREDFPPRSSHVTSTRQCPFSFDERDSVRRSAQKKRIEELRQIEEVILTLGTRFRANPVRKYKPLVLRPSSRPPTIPQTPFSHRDK